MKKLKINIPIYEIICTIIFNDDIADFIRGYGKKRKWKDELMLTKDENVYGYAVPVGDLKNYILFYSKENLTCNLISHEISHLVDFILEERGIELSGEARAYLTGHISEKVYEYAHKCNLIKWEKDKPMRIKKPKNKIDETPDRLLQEDHKNPGGTQE